MFSLFPLRSYTPQVTRMMTSMHLYMLKDLKRGVFREPEVTFFHILWTADLLFLILNKERGERCEE